MRASPMAQQVKNLPPVQEAQEMWVWSLGQEDPLEESLASDSNILAWRIPWTGEPGGLQSKGMQRVGRDWAWTWTQHRVPLLGDSAFEAGQL